MILGHSSYSFWLLTPTGLMTDDVNPVIDMEKSSYSLEQIDRWREQLGELARQPRTLFSKRDAVEALIEPIQLALQSHSYEVVAKRLESWGLVISAGSLKQYVSRYRREQSHPTPSTGKGKRKRAEAALTERELSRELQGESNHESNHESQREFNSVNSVPAITLLDSESNPLALIADEGESRQAAAIAPSPDSFDLESELAAVPENGTATQPQPWTEPTFNRNRVRPQRS
jgi:hypothetical protein